MNKIQLQIFIVIIGMLLCVAGYKGVEKYFTRKYVKETNYILAYNSFEEKEYTPVSVDEITLTTETTTTTTLTTTTEVTTTTTKTTAPTTTKVVEEQPKIVDNGEIIYDGLTLTGLTDKLNKNLNSTLTNTGLYFSEYFVKTGLDPYLSVAIVLHETGCKWTCSKLVRTNYNIGGLKSGGSYIKYNTLEEGIDGYLNILYNNYYLKGLTTAELIQPKYAPYSTTWINQINNYITKIKES